MSDQNAQIIKIICEKVLEYFNDEFKDDKDMLEFVNQSTLIDNIDSIICRARNFKNQIPGYNDLKRKLSGTTMEVVQQIREEIGPKIEKELTIQQAVKICQNMTLSDICEHIKD